MKKNLKLKGMTGGILSLLLISQMFFAVEVQAGQNDDKGEYITEVLKDAQDIMKGVPILDITSVPAHAVIAVEQEFIHLRTDVEDELKNLIKERISVTKDKNKQEIDTKMAKVKIPSKEANKAVAEGIVGKGIGDDKGEIEKDGEKSTYDLAMQQQANWTSSAGSLNAQEEYEKKRAYIEQEQAIRMLGTVGVLRKNIEKKLLCSDGPMQKLASNYEQSDAKKDLDPNGEAKKSTDVTENALDEYKMVEKTNDYNQVLRQYAFNGLVYDQLLSLEQQVLGLRLQAVAGKSAQDMDTLSDKLTTNKQQDEAVADQ